MLNSAMTDIDSVVQDVQAMTKYVDQFKAKHSNDITQLLVSNNNQLIYALLKCDIYFVVIKSCVI